MRTRFMRSGHLSRNHWRKLRLFRNECHYRSNAHIGKVYASNHLERSVCFDIRRPDSIVFFCVIVMAMATNVHYVRRTDKSTLFQESAWKLSMENCLLFNIWRWLTSVLPDVSSCLKFNVCYFRKFPIVLIMTIRNIANVSDRISDITMLYIL